LNTYIFGPILFAMIAVCGIVQAYAEQSQEEKNLDAVLDSFNDPDSIMNLDNVDRILTISICGDKSQMNSFEDSGDYSKGNCDYEIQRIDKQCDNFELTKSICAKGSGEYETIQAYLEREGFEK